MKIPRKLKMEYFLLKKRYEQAQLKVNDARIQVKHAESYHGPLSEDYSAAVMQENYWEAEFKRIEASIKDFENLIKVSRWR